MSSFINLYGGNKETMRHSGMRAVNEALKAGLTINQIRDQAAREGISFGINAQNFLNARPANSFVAQYGGNENTMKNTGLQGVFTAMNAGLTPQQIEERAAAEGVIFGSGARQFLDNQRQQRERQEAERAFHEQTRQRFEQQMLGLQNQMAQQQSAYQDSLSQMQNTLRATMNPQTRESVLGVKGAGNDSSNTAKLNRQGMKGSFARTGLRIKSLNI